MLSRWIYRLRTVGLALALGAWGGAAAAFAHDVREMTVDARVHADRIEVVVVVSAHFAGVILDETGGGGPLSADNFAASHALLEARARHLCVLRSGEGETLPLVGLDVVRGEQDEVMFFLGYGPAGGPDLSLEVPLLERLEAGYTVAVKVIDEKRRPLAAGALTRGQARLAVSVARVGAEPGGG